jgi:glycosyltransferase involved in cell wall biosynthesis
VVSGTGGGPDKTILNSPRFLAGGGYRMLCAYMRHPEDSGFKEIEKKAHSLQAPLLALDDHGPLDWRLPLELLRICRRERVRIWHAHDYKSNALGLLLRRFWPMRLVTTVHGWVKHTRRTPLYYQIDRFCLPYYDHVICVSSDLQETSLTCGVAPERCALIENAIDTSEYSRRCSVTEAKKTLGLPATRLLIGAVGRLSAEKGFDLLIRAAHRLLTHGHDLTLWIFGEGDQAPALNSLIYELGCQDRIRLMGFQAEIIPYYEAMDVFALSSISEGLPNVVLEAMALEVPVVATRIAGLPRIIVHKENGLLTEPGSVADLSSPLAELLRDTTLRVQLGHAGRRTVEERYGFTSRMEKIRALYDNLIDRRCGISPSKASIDAMTFQRSKMCICS